MRNKLAFIFKTIAIVLLVHAICASIAFAQMTFAPIVKPISAPITSTTAAAAARESSLNSKTQETAANTGVPAGIESNSAAPGIGNTNSISINSIEAKTEAPKDLAVVIGLGRSNSLYRLNDGAEYSSWDFSFNPSYKINDRFRISSLIEYSKDINHPEDSDYGRTNVGLSFLGLKLGATPITLKTTLTVPQDKVQKISQQQLYNLSVTSSLKLDPSVSGPLGITFILNGLRYVHKYETALSGKMNNQWGSSQALELDYSFNDTVSVVVDINHINRWTYEGALREYYSHSEEIDFQLTKEVAFSVAHALGLPVVNSRNLSGQYEYDLLDDTNSTISLGLTYTY